MRKLTPLILLISVTLLWQEASAQPRALRGQIDLRNFDFQYDQLTELRGEWNFIPGKFIDPKYTKDIRRFIEVPSLWEEETGFGTYHLRILLSSNRPLLAMEIPDIYSSYQLYLNRELLGLKGFAGRNKEESVPYRSIQIVNIPEQIDTVDLVLHVSNFRHHKAGISRPILIGQETYLDHRRLLSRTFDAFIIGCLMVGFVFFLSLFYFGQHDYTSLFFGLFCLVFGIRTFTSGNFLVNVHIPTFPWDLQIRIEYGSLYLSSILFGYFVYYLFPNILSKVFIRTYAVITSVFLIGVLLLQPYYFTLLNSAQLIIMFLGVAFITFIFLKSALINKQESWYSLVTIVGFLLVLTTKSLDYFRVIDENLIVVFFGQLLFFVSQTVVLSNHYSESWRRAKETAEQSEAAKTNFLSVMSHEIRTPLNSVIGTVYHLLGKSHEKEHEESLRHLRASSENLLHIVNNILDFNKLESGNLKLNHSAVRIGDVAFKVTETIRPLVNEKGLEMRVSIDEGIPALMLDETRLIQILLNLMNNAVKFTPEGSIELKIKKIDQDKNQCFLEVAVIDSGIGIGTEYLEDIFNPFHQISTNFSRRYQGTGLGLTITKKLVELMDSDLKIETEKNVGSQFCFNLKSIIATEEVETRTEQDRDLKGLRILLVDDHDLNVMMTKNFLESWNCDLSIAMNGKEALQKVKTFKYDLILMDIQMPGMDGFETTEKIRAGGFEGQVIAVSADSFIEESRLTSSGIDDFILKPFDPFDLFSVINQNQLKEHTPQTDL